ncbi:cation/H(+) antiporter, partial [Streptomyces sp. MS2A]|nr:cation/H(+) antiporter [Streptomyces sp. MS2A]
FIAGYVLVLAVLGPVVAGRAHVLAGALRAGGRLLPGTTATAAVPGGGTAEDTEADRRPVPARASSSSGPSPSSAHAEAER